MKEKYLQAGKIINTHGVRGELKLEPWADDAEFLRKVRSFFIDGKAVPVLSSRVHKGTLIVKLEGVDDVNAAMRLRSRIVYIDRDEIELPAGSFFIQDIIGAGVFDLDGEKLGTLVDVLDRPAGNVYVVRSEPDGREILIPAVPEFIRETDAEGGRIVVSLIEGF